MAIYEVYASVQNNEVAFVRDRASVLALVFPGPWLLWNRLWFAFAVYFVVSLFLLMAGNTVWGGAIALLSFIPGIYVFLEGTNWISARKQQQRMELVDLVEAENLEAAELRYFSKSAGLNGQNRSKPSNLEKIGFAGSPVGSSRMSHQDKPEFGLFAEE